MKNTVKRSCPIIIAPSEQREAVIHLRKMVRKGLIIFDFETTGLNAKKDQIIRINAIKLKNGKIKDTFNTYVNNKIHITKEIVTLTGITDDAVTSAPDISDAMRLFSIFTSENGYALASYNSSFEKEFLSVWDFNHEIEVSEIIDLLPIVKTILKGKIRSYSLISLGKYFGLSPVPCPRLTAEIILSITNGNLR